MHFFLAQAIAAAVSIANDILSDNDRGTRSNEMMVTHTCTPCLHAPMPLTAIGEHRADGIMLPSRWHNTARSRERSRSEMRSEMRRCLA